MVSREQIEAFFHGKELPAEIVEEIHLALDDPESEVSRLSAEYARITRMMFDPDGPIPSSQPPPDERREELE